MNGEEYLLKYKKAIAGYSSDQTRRELFHLQWHITDVCNLRCTHCYSEDNLIRDLPLHQLKEIFDKFLKTILKWNVRGEISLTGGEPILRNDFFEFLNYVHKRWKENRCFRVSLMSNGTCIDDDLVSHLKSYWPMLREVQVSMDGVHEETHEKVRGKGTFQKTKNSFFLLHNSGFGTALHYVVHKGNYTDAFDILEFGEELKVKRITLSRLVPEGRGKGLSMLTPSELKDLWVHLSEKCLEFYPKGVFLARSRCDLWHLVDKASTLYSLKWGAQDNTIPGYLQIGQRCPIGINGLVLDADGTVYPCRRLPIPIGNITQDTFFNIWYSSKLLWKFRYREKHMKGKCQDCPFLTDEELRYLCAGGSPCVAYGHSSDCFMPDSQCWFDPYSGEQIEEVEKWRKLILKQEKIYSS
jgi:radical SAM protein with 4Fe4S-binding SPASM domain